MSRTVYYDTSGDEIDTEENINDATTYAQEQLADIEHHEAVNKAVDHPDYCKTCGIEAIDVIKAYIESIKKYITKNLAEGEHYAQLAEECNELRKAELEEKYEITLNKMYSTLYKIISLLEEEKETHKNNLSIRDYEALYTSTTNLKEEVDATMGAIYEVLPLYKGEMVVEKRTMELESKYFSFIKKLTKKIPEWRLYKDEIK